MNVNIILENKLGLSLLDPATPGYYNSNNFKVYYLIDGQEVLFNKPKWDYSSGFFVANEYGKSFVRIFLNMEGKTNPSTTYIQWNSGDKDTLVCRLNEDERGAQISVADAWYNGVKVLPENYAAEYLAGYPNNTFRVVK